MSINYTTTNPRDVDKILESEITKLTDSSAYSFSIGSLPNATDYVGNALITDVGGGSLWRSDGYNWAPINGSVVIYKNTTPSVAHTGNTTETLLEEILIPGKLLGPTGGLRITNRITTTNNANTKTFKVRIGTATGIGGTVVNDPQWTSNATITCMTWIDNTGVENSQIGFNGNPIGSGTPNAWRTSSINTASNFLVSITGQLANSADSIQVVSTTIELVRI